MRKHVPDQWLMIVLLSAVVTAGTLAMAQSLTFSSTSIRPWLTIACARADPTTLASCTSAVAPPKVVFDAYPDDRLICVAATDEAQEQCVTYGAFKAWAGKKP